MLYNEGKQDKTRKWSAERAQAHLLQSVIAHDWEQRFICKVAKIKQFFQSGPPKPKKADRFPSVRANKEPLREDPDPNPEPEDGQDVREVPHLAAALMETACAIVCHSKSSLYLHG
jgi:hypothetical protein